MNAENYVPRITKEGKIFWDAVRRHKYVFQECRVCKRRMFPPRLRCPTCLSENLKWIKATGKGKVYSYTVRYLYPPPGFKAPYVLALVDLEEGVRVLSQLVGSKPEDLRCGLDVEVVFEGTKAKFALPKFRPRRRLQ